MANTGPSNLALFILLASAGLAGTGCQDEPRGVGGPCEYSDDCKDGLICKFGYCNVPDTESEQPCEVTADCGDWHVCKDGLCTVPLPTGGPGDPCEIKLECHELLVCRDGECHAPDGTCETHQQCISSFCLDGYCCGDDVCLDAESCSVDCSPDECGDSICQPQESCASCPWDCGPCDDPDPVNPCDNLAPLSWRGAIPVSCSFPNPYELMLADDMLTVWRQGPSALCSYNGFLYNYGACGMLPANNASFCPYDDQISWDFNMMNSLAYYYGDFAAVTVLAHEWGHRNQYATGILTIPSNKIQELHADCQAGIYAAIAEARGLVDTDDVRGSFSALCYFGDPYLSPWFAPGAHGTCPERIGAFEYGYVGARNRFDAVCGSAPLDAMRTICG